VVISGTRVVFPGKEKEVTVRLTNDGKQPALVQTWLDTGDQTASPDKIDAPFLVTPTIFRLEAGKGQMLRIIHIGEPLPADKESLFWLNVLEVPPKVKATDDDDRNRIQFAFRTRIKLMYRPDGLPGRAEDAPKQLKWVMSTDAAHQSVLKATNPTRYVVNLGSVTLLTHGKSFDGGLGYVLPGETAVFPIKDVTEPVGNDAAVEYSSVDDWGGIRPNKVTVAR